MSARSQQLARVGELVAAGDVCVEIAGLIPLGEVARAHELSESRHTRGKLVLALPPSECLGRSPD